MKVMSSGASLMITALSAIVVNGCAQLVQLPVSSETAQAIDGDSQRRQPTRDNLLQSLRHDENYGVIRQGSVEILYRDLTRPKKRSGVSNTETLAQNKTDVEVYGVIDSAAVAPESTEATTTMTAINDTIAVYQGEAVMVPAAMSETDAVDAPDVKMTVFETDRASGSGCQGANGYSRKTDEAWLAGLDEKRWTIQVVSARDSVEPCIGDTLSSTDRRRVHRYSVFFENQLWNIGLHGTFSTMEKALAYASTLEDSWVRNVGEMRVRRCNSVRFMPDLLRREIQPWCDGEDVLSESNREIELDHKPVSRFERGYASLWLSAKPQQGSGAQ